jgi:hypothetical protein
MARRLAEADAHKADAMQRLTKDMSSGPDTPSALPHSKSVPFVTMADAAVGGSSLGLDMGYSYDEYDDGDEEDDEP